MDSMHPPLPAGWADMPLARVHFMRINMEGAHRVGF